LFGKRKRRLRKVEADYRIPQTGEKVTARETAYLDHLERMIASPDLSPYIQRKSSGRQTEEIAPVEPVFDSGPVTADQVNGTPFAPGAEQPFQHRSHASVATDDGHVRLGDDGVYEITIDVPNADLPEAEEPPRRRRAREKPPAARKPSRPAPKPQAEPRVEAGAVEEPPKPQGLFPTGTLVLWNSEHLGIYKEYLDHKGYDVLYVVQSDGRLHPEGVYLAAYDPRRVGLLSDGIFKWMEGTMRWDREALVFHLDNPDDVKRLAVFRQSPPAGRRNGGPAPAGEAKAEGTLVRGRAFTITVGKHQWSGVYWGRDAMGTVVAHTTNGAWSLMHLDLARFGSDAQFGDLLSGKEIRQIEDSLNGQG